jgi:hypothetical protein
MQDRQNPRPVHITERTKHDRLDCDHCDFNIRTTYTDILSSPGPHFLVNQKSHHELYRLPDVLVIAKPMFDAHNVHFPFGTSLHAYDSDELHPEIEAVPSADIVQSSITSLTAEPPLSLTTHSPFENHTISALDNFLPWGELDYKDVPTAMLPTLCELSGQTIVFWSHVIPYTDNRVQQIRITLVDFEPTVREFKEFLRVIGSCCPALRTLALSLDLSNHTKKALKEFFKPLLRCRKLQNLELHIYPDPCQSITDKDVDIMACAWPDSQSLKLTNETEWDFEPPPPPLTLRSAFSLGARCPHLQSVAMALDLRTIPEPPSTIHAIDKFDFSYSSVVDPTNLASALVDFVDADGVTWTPLKGDYYDDEPIDRTLRENSWNCTRSFLKRFQHEKVERLKLEDTNRELRLANHALQVSLDSLNFNMLSAMGWD